MRNHRLRTFAPVFSATAFALTALTTSVVPAGQPTVELSLKDHSVTGRIAGRGTGWCVLFDRSGAMHTIDLDRVTDFRKVSSSFYPHSFNAMRNRLLKEFGRGFEVATTRHYVVCAPKGRARSYCNLFEQTWRRFHMYFAIRGFQMENPEFPLVAVVLKDRKSFLEYARRENARVDSSILGYYWSRHNRVIMFQDQDSHAAIPGRTTATSERQMANTMQGSLDPAERFQRQQRLENAAWNWAFEPGSLHASDLPRAGGQPSVEQLAARAGIDASLRETMVHEATHQLGYNLGLHNRTGRNPKWIVEGLATVFEAPGLEEHASDPDGKKRINKDWLPVFRRFVEEDRPDGFLKTFIRDDRLFQTSMSDAYAQAWALSFWLIETRPRAYAEFLQEMASPEVARRLTPDIRVRLFKEAFGDNLILLDAEMRRYFARLN